jgi:hypothetical protein
MPVINRRLFLSGLITAPAVVAFDSLMPIRGSKFVGFHDIGNDYWWGGDGKCMRINELIRRLKNDGTWEKLDKLWIFKGERIVDLKGLFSCQ